MSETKETVPLTDDNKGPVKLWPHETRVLTQARTRYENAKRKFEDETYRFNGYLDAFSDRDLTSILDEKEIKDIDKRSGKIGEARKLEGTVRASLFDRADERRALKQNRPNRGKFKKKARTA